MKCKWCSKERIDRYFCNHCYRDWLGGSHFNAFLGDAMTQAQYRWEDGSLVKEGDSIPYEGYSLHFLAVVDGDAVRFSVVFDEKSPLLDRLEEIPDFVRENRTMRFAIGFGKQRIAEVYSEKTVGDGR